MLTLDSVYLLTDSNTSLKSRTRNKAVLEVAFNTSFRSEGDLQVEAQPKLFSKLLKWVREVPWAAWLTKQNYPTVGGETRRGSRALHHPGRDGVAAHYSLVTPLEGASLGPSLASAPFGHISCCNGFRALHSSGTCQSSVLFPVLPQPPLSSDARGHSLWTTLLDLPEAAF